MKVLVVEDEAKMARLLQRGLAEEGHQVDTCPSAEEAVAQAERIDYDVIVLDWGLPGLDGVAALRTWRDRGVSTPVLMLTARGTTGEKVTALRAGADDYLVKPFDFDELLARLEALRRRGVAVNAPTLVGDVTIDAPPGVAAGHIEVVRSPAESSRCCSNSLGIWATWSRSRLLHDVWGDDFDGTGNVVDVYVGYLRAKFERLGTTALHLEAVRGVGYRLTKR